jgi:hypothetical protein
VQCRSRPAKHLGKAADDGTVRANKFHRTCRGSGDGMQAKDGPTATREALAVIAVLHGSTGNSRETGRAGRVADRPVITEEAG